MTPAVAAKANAKTARFAQIINFSVVIFITIFFYDYSAISRHILHRSAFKLLI